MVICRKLPWFWVVYGFLFFSHIRSKHLICITVLIRQYKCTLMSMATSYKLLIR